MVAGERLVSGDTMGDTLILAAIGAVARQRSRSWHQGHGMDLLVHGSVSATSPEGGRGGEGGRPPHRDRRPRPRARRVRRTWDSASSCYFIVTLLDHVVTMLDLRS